MNELETRLGYTFRDRKLLEHALTHSSWSNERGSGHLGSNERLEFLGDSVLGWMVAENLYRRFPDMPEGDMTRLRAELVCEASLHKTALALGLGGYMRLGRGEEHTGGRERPSILADIVEAIIAALYLDSGMDEARRFVRERVLTDAAFDESQRGADCKTRLQELVQRKSNQVIAYRLVEEQGPDHDKTFTFEVLINGESAGRGSGKTKKEAEQMAARAALTGYRE